MEEKLLDEWQERLGLQDWSISTRHQLIDDLARALVMAKRGETKRQLGKMCKKIIDYNKKEN